MVTTVPGTVYQSVARYECDEGYNLVGDMTQECQASGEWSNSPPQCESKFSCTCSLLGSWDDLSYECRLMICITHMHMKYEELTVFDK